MLRLMHIGTGLVKYTLIIIAAGLELGSCATPNASVGQNGYAAYEFSCSRPSESLDIDPLDDCHENARDACPDGYAVLEETYPMGRLFPNVRGIYVECAN